MGSIGSKSMVFDEWKNRYIVHTYTIDLPLALSLSLFTDVIELLFNGTHANRVSSFFRLGKIIQKKKKNKPEDRLIESESYSNWLGHLLSRLIRNMHILP